MPKGRGIVRTPLVILSCCGVLCLLQCAEKSRRKVERPLDAARLIVDRIKDTQTQAQALAAVGVKYAELGYYKPPSTRSTRSTVATIDNEFERSKALQQIAFEYVKTKEFRQALKIALGIPDARTQF
jgi:hypothetical protein